MKDECKKCDASENNDQAPVGDVIGDTAYSERFVLKILLKLANLDTLKDEIQDKTFEDDLCTLWDMTAERDVVLFLQKHSLLNLVNFALPVIESQRIIELIIGIIGNMCCHKEVVATLLNMEQFLTALMEFVNSDDSLILIQVLRFVNSCLFHGADDNIPVLIDEFKKVNYSNALYFILKNSSNKNLLMTAFENLNTICTYCNIEKCRIDFFKYFVTFEALECLFVAFKELVNLSLEEDELERLLLVCLQIILNLIGFDKSQEIYENIIVNIADVIEHILSYYQNKVVKQKEIDTDLVDVILSINTIIKMIKIIDGLKPDTFFLCLYSIWEAIQISRMSDGGNWDIEDGKDLKELAEKVNIPICTTMCLYLDKCTESNLLRLLDKIDMDYEKIINCLEDDNLIASVNQRSAKYRSRLKDNVDS